MYDCIVIGSGPCGISAAIYLKRFGLNVLVIGSDYGTLSVNTLIENYYGINSIYGVDLIEKGILQARNLGIEVLCEEVVKIEMNDLFVVGTNKSSYSSKTVFIATGMKRTSVNVSNLKEFVGRGVSYCAVCDGFLYRKKRIGLLGSGDFMKSELDVLKRFSKDIVVFTNGDEVSLDDVLVVKDEVISVEGNDFLSSVTTRCDKYFIDALFVAVGMASGSSFASHLGLIVDDFGHLVVNDYMTNIPGIFAGGDVIGGVKQIVKAASDGCCAAYKIKDYLKGL